MDWIKITENLPQNGQECLFYCRGTYGVAAAELYDESTWAWAFEEDSYMSLEQAEVFKLHIENAKGRFKEFGVSYSFNDSALYWMPVPEAPK